MNKPWKYEDAELDEPWYYIYDGENNLIAETDNPYNATRIVNLANAHTQLIAELGSMMTVYIKWQSILPDVVIK